jgi:hypothetical protein
MEYISKFRKLFGLSGKNTSSAMGQWDTNKDYWISLCVNKYGLLRLSLWERWEPYQVQLGWFKGELAVLDGSPEELAPLLWVAEQLGLPDHPDFETIRGTEEYRKIAETGITLE